LGFFRRGYIPISYRKATTELMGMSNADELRKLAALRDEGLLSQKEFQVQRQRLLEPDDHIPSARRQLRWRLPITGLALVLTLALAVLAFRAPSTPNPTAQLQLQETAASTTQVQTALAYAESFVGKDHEAGLCLQFVSEAWSAAGVNIGGRFATDTAAAYWNSDPESWPKHVSTHVYNNPPAGALMFWGTTQWSSGGHVALSLGNGSVVSTSAFPYANASTVNPSPNVFVFSLSRRSPSTYNYLGYIMPLDGGSPPPATTSVPSPTLTVAPPVRTTAPLQGGDGGATIQPVAGGTTLQPVAPIPPAQEPTAAPRQTPVSSTPTPTQSSPTPTPASLPTYTVMNTDSPPPDGVWFRWAPHTADTNRITGDGVYANEQVQLQCYAWGDAVGPYNDTLWYFVVNLTRPTIDGTADSGYLNAHYIDDGAIAGQVDSGVPAC
jgi:hypothetical protein